MVATRQKIAQSPGLSADYDREADVLYIALGEPRPAEGEDAPRGLVYRYAMDDNSPCGVTVVGFKRNKWKRDVLELSKLIAKYLHVRLPNVIDVIKDSIGE